MMAVLVAATGREQHSVLMLEHFLTKFPYEENFIRMGAILFQKFGYKREVVAQ